MKQIRISDITMRQVTKAFSLSFREKIELAKLLDGLGVSVIELEGVGDSKTDALRVKSVAAAVKNSVVAVPVALEMENLEVVWNAVKQARHPRLQVCAAVSSVQMEYLHHKKPEAMQKIVCEIITACKKFCNDVEFVADDATRSEPEFLYSMIGAAIEAGATTVTVCDTAGSMLPEEFGVFVSGLKKSVPALETVCLGVSCCDTLSMADACAIAAVCQGVGEIKAAAYPVNTTSLPNIARLRGAEVARPRRGQRDD